MVGKKANTTSTFTELLEGNESTYVEYYSRLVSCICGTLMSPHLCAYILRDMSDERLPSKCLAESAETPRQHGGHKVHEPHYSVCGSV